MATLVREVRHRQKDQQGSCHMVQSARGPENHTLLGYFSGSLSHEGRPCRILLHFYRATNAREAAALINTSIIFETFLGEVKTASQRMSVAATPGTSRRGRRSTLWLFQSGFGSAYKGRGRPELHQIRSPPPSSPLGPRRGLRWRTLVRRGTPGHRNRGGRSSCRPTLPQQRRPCLWCSCRRRGSPSERRPGERRRIGLGR